jgi:Reverse transcriptase (RNA-dependent DNA polymerase)
VQKAIYGLIFTQMTAQKGIKKHGQAAFDALRKEFEQFRAMDILEPLNSFELTNEQKSESLRALSVIEEKRDGKLKGRTIADGSAQKGKFSKSETGSPTVASDVVLLTTMIDAYENRDVAVADVTGAYLHAHMKDFISMRFTGWVVDLLCEVNPEYSQFAAYEGKTKVLYVRCNKAIYRCVVSGMLWYELFSQTLEKHGFTINPYDFCVANATIDGSQCTIVWYVDDTKISHKNPSVVTNIIAILESHFGKMSVSRGARHKFLGMHLHFLGDGTATVHMPSYLQSAIDDSGLPIIKPAPTLAAASLLHIEQSLPLLPVGRARTFHSVVAKLIYAGTRARTDILLALGFLCSRVSAPTEQDERKLFRLLAYLLGTLDLKFRLGADSLKAQLKWKAMVRHCADNALATLTFVIFSSRITPNTIPSPSSTAQPGSCSPITLPSHYKVPSSVFSVSSYLVNSLPAHCPHPPHQGTRSVLMTGTTTNPNPRAKASTAILDSRQQQKTRLLETDPVNE